MKFYPKFQNSILLGLEIQRPDTKLRYLNEVLDVAALVVSKEAETQMLGMFLVILTDLKKRKQPDKLMKISQNLLESIDQNNNNRGEFGTQCLDQFINF